MSELRADFERASILARAKALVGGRVYDAVPDNLQLALDAQGRPKPYIVLHYGVVYATRTDRTIEGEAEQPHVLPITAECWAISARTARDVAGAVRELFVGWTPAPASEPITAPGGVSFRDKDAAGAPSRYMEAVALETVINVGDNTGYVPDPGDPGGGVLIPTVQQIVLEILAVLGIGDGTAPGQVFPFPNPVGQWSVVHALGRIPSFSTYSLTGERLLTDEMVTATTAVATWAQPTAGFALVN